MKLKNAIGIVGCFCTLTLLLACHSTNPPSENVKTIYVGPTMADGEGVGPMTCLLIRESPDAEYQMFYSPIRGFDYVPGFEYELKVNVTERENVPADASKFTYELIEVVSAKESGLSLDSRKWALVDRIEGSQVDLRFEDGQASGRAGINRYFAGYEQEGSSLQIGNAGSTMMAGPQELMDQEQAFLGVLGSVASFRIVGEELRLLNGDGTVVLSLVPALEASLSPGIWSATGINNGKGGVVSLLAGSKVVVQFDETGRVFGDSGCNTFQGSYEINGESLKVGPLASTRKMCSSPEGIMEQETNVLKALEKASTFKVDGSSLELRDESGALQIKFVQNPPEVMLSVTVPDVHGFLDEVGAVAAKAYPMMSGAFIKTMIGMKVGDPYLSGIPPGKGLAVVALDRTNIFAVVELTEAQSTNYLNRVRSQGLQANYSNGALLLAKTPEALAKGERMAASTREVLLGQPSSTLRVALQPAAIIERNATVIDGFMQMLPVLMGRGVMQQPGATLESAQLTTQILEGELRVLLSVAAQCEVAEVILAPKNGSIQVSETFEAKAGTRLATLLNSPVLSEKNPDLHAGLLGEATVLADFHLGNSDALGEFFGTEVENLLQAMQWADIDVAGLVATMKKWYSIYSGPGCEAITLGVDGKMKVACVVGIKDEAATLEVMRTMGADMAPFLKLYENLGMPMTLEFRENMGETNGVSIHQMGVKTDLSSMMEDQKTQMESMGLENMVYDLAIADGLLFYSEPGGIPELMKQVKEPVEAEKIQAHKIYPADGFYYFDFNLDGYMAFVAAMMPDDPSSAMMKQQMGTLFKGVEPITSAGFKADGRVMWSVNVPGDLIAKIGQLSQMMQMQQQQMGVGQGMPVEAPQAAPVDAPEPNPDQEPQPVPAP